MKKKIEKWGDLTNQIVAGWIYKYFELSDDEEIYFDWVTVGGVFNFAAYWFDLNTVLECYELDITKKQLFEWYDKSLLQEIDLPLREFILSPAKREEARVKHLAELEERVKTAKKELEKAIYEYGTES